MQGVVEFHRLPPVPQAQFATMELPEIELDAPSDQPPNQNSNAGYFQMYD
jgi:hypothetical protein